MSANGHNILVIGMSSPLLEGVADLLQLAGYRVKTTSSWAEIEYALHIPPPNLVIVELSGAPPDAYRLPDKIRSAPRWAAVPILFVSFSGDDILRITQRRTRERGGGPVHFYAHTLLGIERLLDQVQACLPS